MRCVLLSGGGGTRLWPLSTSELPKQYLALPDGQSIFQKTLQRNETLFDSFTVVTNRRYRDLTMNELDSAGVSDRADVVLEPLPRNTAPAIAIAALLADPCEVLLVAPTDHYIQGDESYASAMKEAEALAQEGFIVVFGVDPTHPHTGYGYIHHQGSDVLAFKEKPDLSTAQRYLLEGGYLWNSGMFAFRADAMLEEMCTYCPDIVVACEQVVSQSLHEDRVLELDEKLFASVRAESIDYAVIEYSRRLRVVGAGFSWCDLGGLDAYGMLAVSDARQNRVLGSQVTLHDCARTSVYNASSRVVVANGLDDLIVAVTDEAVYVTCRDCADGIKDLV